MSLEYDSNPVGAAVQRSDLPAMAASGSPKSLSMKNARISRYKNVNFSLIKQRLNEFV
jgi:hypothetical protein